jgi:hypothetical protein
MRLLNVRTKKLHTFFNDKIPPYVILSHTWLEDDEEVTFEQIRLLDGYANMKYADQIGRMPGFHKILFICGRAIKEGYEWAWIDTCCIEKSSSVELAEALNSMFRWYQNAEKCYVYLADIQGERGFYDGCRWFTRGWTLQELLAPKLLVFYDQHGQMLGDRERFRARIQRLTGIPAEALDGSKPISDFSVDERLSWAEGRETKREEDAAYCLMGLCHVHIPLIYGEGRRKAMVRLRREIAISLQEEAWDAPPLPMPVPAAPSINSPTIGPSPASSHWLQDPSGRDIMGEYYDNLCNRTEQHHVGSTAAIALTFALTKPQQYYGDASHFAFGWAPRGAPLTNHHGTEVLPPLLFQSGSTC